MALGLVVIQTLNIVILMREPLNRSHYAVFSHYIVFGNHRYCVVVNIMVLVCHVIPQNHLANRPLVYKWYSVKVCCYPARLGSHKQS